MCILCIQTCFFPFPSCILHLLFTRMACFQTIFCLLFAAFIFLEGSGLAAYSTCKNCFTPSRASHYLTSDDKGTETGRCGYGTYGATINGGSVAAASDLYQDGVGCGACYQVRCTKSYYCSTTGVTVVITDHGSGDGTDFIMSRKAFGGMAQNASAAASLLARGTVDIEYRRVPCSYTKKNITIKIDENSNNPYYLGFTIQNQQGMRDITAVQLCETESYTCKLLDRTYGAVWTTTSPPPNGPLSIRMLFSNANGDEEWVVPVKDIPQNWKSGEIYDTGVQDTA